MKEQLDWQSFELDTTCLNVYAFEPGYIPDYSDSILADRMAKLNSQTSVDLQYNSHVKAFINLYVKQRRDVTSRVLGLAALYYPMFEEKLDQFDMPLELKHLAVVESALNASAKSRVGASGLWQFMYPTGKMYGLEVDTYVDERRDPYKSTVAACRYMSYLYKIYGDWNLVLAAYNSGPGNVNKAIRRSGGKRDYWEIRAFLPRETRGYVPAFIAVNYMMNYAAEHNLYPSKPAFMYAEVDTLHICRETTFEQISLVTDVSVEELQLLNPSVKQNVIPQREKCKIVYMPVDVIGTYLANEDSIDNFKLPEPIVPVVTYITDTYTVRSGDVLGVIAQRHGVGVMELKEWNNLRSNNIHPGQKLVIQKSATSAQKPSKPAVQTTASVKTSAGKEVSVEDYRIHTVQSGDTLWDIAKKYPGISVTDLKNANSSLNFNSLKPGQKIKIPPTT
jgi:membrane-bound lytic murein transglycosylase D